MDTEADAIDNAAKRVAQLLQRPEQLEKVDDHRRRLLREKESVDARLRTALQTQIDNVKTGLELLRAAIQHIHQIKSNLASVDALCKSSRALGIDAAEFKGVNDARKTLLGTKKNLDRIFVVPQTVLQLKNAMEAEDCNLLYIYENLSALEFIRDELLYHARNMPDEKHALQWYFAEVDTLSELLAKRLWSLLDQSMHLVKSKRHVLVSVLRIIEREERADIQVLDPAAIVKVDTSRRPKRYKEKAFNRLIESIDNRFESVAVDDKEHVEIFLDRCSQFILEDLSTVKNEFVPCFPERYNIFMFYVQEYSDHMEHILTQLSYEELGSSQIIAIINWLRKYADTMKKKLDIKVKDPLPIERQDVLLEKYRKVVKEKMHEWSGNIIKNEIQEWITSQEKTTPPETNPNGLYVTEASIILFQIIDQHVDVALLTRHGKFISEVVQLCTETLRDFLNEFDRALVELGNNYFAQLPEDRARFMVEFLMCVINNLVHCTEYTNQLRARIEEVDIIPPASLAKFKTDFDFVVERFHQVASVPQGILTRIIMCDLDPVILNLFTRKWYDSPRDIETVIATLDDYSKDVCEHTQRDYYYKIIVSCFDLIVISIVKVMFSKKAVIKPVIKELLKKDIDRFKQFFQEKLKDCKEQKLKTQVTNRMDFLNDLLALATDTESVLALSFLKIHGRHPDFTPEHVDILLSCREDMKSRGSVMKMLRETIEKSGTRRPATVANDLVVFSNIPIR